MLARGWVSWWQEEKHQEEFRQILEQVRLRKEEESQEEKLKGKTFVITGSLEYFSNRNALKELIEKQGGKVTGSVTKKTDYLINNDSQSSSAKNKKARELGIPVLTEKEFLNLLDEEEKL